MTYQPPLDLERTRYAYPVPVVPGSPPPGPRPDASGFGPVTPGPAVARKPPTAGTATAAMALGIVGAVGGWYLLGLPCLAAIVLGHQGLRVTRDGALGGRGIAVAGLVLGYLFAAAWTLAFLLGGMGAVVSAP
ncbi:DUF4190 domain-containing protein [Krasilnikovia sp. MM14-A1004]|uniref:DUF4190 domain-containing protein n=1 Tax=Krasilnikovia sp. MM14-A1004 TaxID=3373541 RepID=UPI00399CA60A